MGPLDTVLEAIRVGRPSDRGPGVGLVDILERVDAQEKWLLSHKELDSSLRRLIESGKIAEVAPGRYAPLRPGGPPSLYRPVDADAYDRAVREYRDGFADDVATVMPWLRGFAPPELDLDLVSISFVIGRVVERFGGTLGDAVQPTWSQEGPDLAVPLSFPVSLPAGCDRDALRQAVMDALTSRSLDHRKTWLLLPDGARLEVGGSRDIHQR